MVVSVDPTAIRGVSPQVEIGKSTPKSTLGPT
jgi:hypothetical protein